MEQEIKRKEMMKYPVLDAKAVAEEGWNTVKNFAGYKIWGWVDDNIDIESRAQDRATSTIWNMLGTYIKGNKDAAKANYEGGLARMSPLGNVYNAFSKGASKTQQLYTIGLEGYEVPIFMTSNIDEDPSTETLKRGINTVIERGMSTYDDDRNRLVRLYDENSFGLASSKFTRGDIDAEGLVEDPARFSANFTKHDAWLIQQYGPRLEDREKTINVNGNDFHVKVYGKPKRMDNFLYWAAGDIIYDIVDVWFDPVQHRIEKYFPVVIGQAMLKEEFKGISKSIRSFFTKRSPPLIFNFDDLPKTQYHSMMERLKKYRTPESNVVDLAEERKKRNGNPNPELQQAA